MVSHGREVMWFGQPAKVGAATFDELRSRLPCFTRQPFGPEGCENGYLLSIVREPVEDDDRRIPVAVVSPQYELIQHHEVLDWLAEALCVVGQKAGSLKGTLILSAYGERMHLRLRLPEYDFDPGDGHPLSLVVHATNSVDKSTALEVSLGWWRQVCSNGMKVQVNGCKARQVHLMGRKRAAGIAEMLKSQMDEIAPEHRLYTQWLSTPVTRKCVEEWADTTLARAWGPHAAARLCHIVRTGWDGVIEKAFEKALPHERRVTSEWQVPGTFAPAKNAYHVSQVLSWLASHRGTLQEQLERTAQVHRLMSSLPGNGPDCPHHRA